MGIFWYRNNSQRLSNYWRFFFSCIFQERTVKEDKKNYADNENEANILDDEITVIVANIIDVNIPILVAKNKNGNIEAIRIDINYEDIVETEEEEEEKKQTKSKTSSRKTSPPKTPKKNKKSVKKESSSNSEMLLTLIILAIDERRSVVYYFVDQKLLKTKYKAIYELIKGSRNSNDKFEIMDVLDKINLTRKLQNKSFKYRIGEILDASF